MTFSVQQKTESLVCVATDKFTVPRANGQNTYMLNKFRICL